MGALSSISRFEKSGPGPALVLMNWTWSPPEMTARNIQTKYGLFMSRIWSCWTQEPLVETDRSRSSTSQVSSRGQSCLTTNRADGWTHPRHWRSILRIMCSSRIRKTRECCSSGRRGISFAACWGRDLAWVPKQRPVGRHGRLAWMWAMRVNCSLSPGAIGSQKLGSLSTILDILSVLINLNNSAD